MLYLLSFPSFHPIPSKFAFDPFDALCAENRNAILKYLYNFQNSRPSNGQCKRVEDERRGNF